MKTFDDLVDLLTDRLRVDPELRLDVARELRAHLEDSAAEFRQAGQSDEQADASAAKALGDPQQLADELWQANRWRIRIRGIFRWSARAALVPGAICVVLAIGVGLSGVPMPWAGDKVFSPAFGGFGFHGSLTDGLTEEQRFIFEGAPSARTPLEQAKSITDRWPENPVYYGNYVVQLICQGGVYDGKRGRIKPERLDEILAVLDKGERIEPDNAFYNFTKAAWLIQAASDISEDESRTYERINRDDEVRQSNCWKIEIHDPGLFQRGLAEFKRGLGKGEFASHSLDMLELRLGLLPEPKRLNDYLRRVAFQASTLLPPLGDYRKLGRSLSAYAIDQAEAGRADEAAELVDSVGLMSAKLGARSRTLVGLLVAQAVRVGGLAHAEQVYEELNRPEQAEQTRQARQRQDALFTEIRKGPRLDERERVHAGMLMAVLTPSLPGNYRPDFEPMRTAEQFVAAEMGLILLLCVLVLLALFLGGLALLSLIIQRPGNKPILLFVGWGRIGKICLLAIVVPVAACALYVYVLTASDRVYGLNYTAGKTLLEFVVTLGAICVLLLGLGYSAIRRRADEIGLVVPPALRLRDRRWLAGVG
ncbi:MAG: permease prefix domain 1-containing protein, partial [Phycisphaerae bacterium]|nr:permease prefix domain 1-containing protein [Phycisphaerae bacterium]